MTIVKHELRLGRVAFWIWSGVLAFLLAVCVFLYPQMKGEMEQMGDIFASMGSFTDAFGMDKLNFGTLIGYYAIECSNTLGLGGAFFAALTAAAALCGLVPGCRGCDLVDSAVLFGQRRYGEDADHQGKGHEQRDDLFHVFQPPLIVSFCLVSGICHRYSFRLTASV